MFARLAIFAKAHKWVYSFVLRKTCEGLLAQLVEQRTLNPSVDSSSLSQPTKDIKHLGQFFRTGLFVSSLCADTIMVAHYVKILS